MKNHILSLIFERLVRITPRIKFIYKGEKFRKYAMPLVNIAIPRTATNNLFSSCSRPIKIKNNNSNYYGKQNTDYNPFSRG